MPFGKFIRAKEMKIIIKKKNKKTFSHMRHAILPPVSKPTTLGSSRKMTCRSVANLLPGLLLMQEEVPGKRDRKLDGRALYGYSCFSMSPFSYSNICVYLSLFLFRSPVGILVT